MRIVAGLSVPEPGDQVVITHDGIDTPATVTAWHPTQQKADVTFPSGATLRVAATLLGQGPTHHRHRNNDIDTARNAADITPEALAEGQRKVLYALADAGPNGLIDHEHERINGLIPTSAGKRRLELRRKGLVEPTGRRRRTGTGNAEAEVWRLTVDGYRLTTSMRQRGVA